MIYSATIAPAASIFSNPITGTNPSNDNPYTTGQTVDPNATASGIGRGSGVQAQNGDNQYVTKNYTGASSLANAITTNKYVTWTISPAANFSINFNDVVLNSSASGTGPGGWGFLSSIGGFTAGLCVGCEQFLVRHLRH
jgi:hypothetical protein